MEKIDRLGWAAGISIEAYGVKVGIRVNRSELLQGLEPRLPPGWKPARSKRVEVLYSLFSGGAGARPGLRRYSLLYGGAQRLARALDLQKVLEALESHLRLSVAAAARRRLFVHAGVVGWHGKAIVIPGRSFSGKTTLVAELVRSGAEYYSDEYAVLDGRGLVHPFPKPLSIRARSLQSRPRTVESLGGTRGVRPLPVALVVLSRYRSGARFRPRRLTPGQAILGLVAHTVTARLQPQKALATLELVASRSLAIKGPRGEAAEIVGSLLGRLDR